MELPTSRNMTEKPDTEKITISNLPLEINNEDIQTFFTSFSGVKLVSEVKYGNCPKRSTYSYGAIIKDFLTHSESDNGWGLLHSFFK